MFYNAFPGPTVSASNRSQLGLYKEQYHAIWEDAKFYDKILFKILHFVSGKNGGLVQSPMVSFVYRWSYYCIKWFFSQKYRIQKSCLLLFLCYYDL